jgi:predicted dehydrogenase
LLIQLEGNLSGTLSLSQVSPGRKNHLAFELSGSKSSLRWDSERPEELWTGFRGRPNQVLLRDPALMSGHRAGFPGGHTQGFADAFKSMFAEVYRAIDTPADARQLTFATFDDGHRQAILGEAIAESAIKRKWVQVTNQGDEFAVQAVAG